MSHFESGFVPSGDALTASFASFAFAHLSLHFTATHSLPNLVTPFPTSLNAERVVIEIDEEIAKIEKDGGKVVSFSIVG